MRTALAVLLAALLLVGILGFFGYELHSLTADSVQTHADLVAAKDANQSQANALATLEADRAADAAQLADLSGKLDAIGQAQQTKHRAFAKVVENATPAVKDLLSSKLPDAALQLFPRSTATDSANTSNKPINP